MPSGTNSSTGEAPGATATADEDAPHPICVACQQPITDGVTVEWRGKPVHAPCGAELRCSVSLTGPGKRGG